MQGTGLRPRRRVRRRRVGRGENSASAGKLSRLVIVSNRVPLPSERGPRAGGLAVALADALRPGTLWFGWSGKRSATSDTHAALQQADGITYATVDLSEHDYRTFYLHFANGALWPLLHFRLGLLNFHSEDYDGYIAVNRRFAEALKPLLRPDDLIWVHDYHLLPLGEALRELGVGHRIGFFLHTPFVPPALLHALPRADGNCCGAVCLRRDRLPHPHLSPGFPGMRQRDPRRPARPGRPLCASRPAGAGGRRPDRHRRRRFRRGLPRVPR